MATVEIVGHRTHHRSIRANGREFLSRSYLNQESPNEQPSLL